MHLSSLVGKTALVLSSAHSSRYGYIGRTVAVGTILLVDSKINVLIEEGRFKGKIWKVPVQEASIELPTAESHTLKGDGAWADDPAPSTRHLDVVIAWEQWQPEG